jgi:hypothetical protein
MNVLCLRRLVEQVVLICRSIYAIVELATMRVKRVRSVRVANVWSPVLVAL